MGSPSRARPCRDLSPSGPPPIFSLAPSRTRKDSKDNASPGTENARSLWFCKLNPRRISKGQGEEPPQAGPNDVELGGGHVEDPDQNIICGCSKANFIVIVLFMIVLLVSAVGGGVGGSLFAGKR